MIKILIYWNLETINSKKKRQSIRNRKISNSKKMQKKFFINEVRTILELF